MVGKSAETDRLLEFISFASAKAAVMQYFTTTDKTNLIHAGESFGLSKSLVESIVNSKAANNPLMLKELTEKVKDLKETKQILQLLGLKPSDYPSVLKSGVSDKAADKHLATQSEPTESYHNPAFMITLFPSHSLRKEENPCSLAI